MSFNDFQEKAENQLKRLANAGNTRETASFCQSIAEELNDDSASSGKSTEDIQKKKEVSDTPTLSPPAFPDFPSPSHFLKHFTSNVNYFYRCEGFLLRLC